MMLFFVRLFLIPVLGNADELLITNVEHPQTEKSEHKVTLENEPGVEDECTLGSYACRLACLDGGICYRNNSESIQFFIVGDTGGVPVYPYITYAQKLVAKSLARIGKEKNIGFVISAGDNMYYTGVKDELDQRFQSSFENVYKGNALEKPWYLIAGNHDHFGNISGQIAYTNRSRRWTFPSNYYKVSYAFGNNSTLVEFLMIDTIVLCGNTRDIVEAGFFDMLFATVDKNPNAPKDPVAAKMELDWMEKQLNSSKADYLFIVGHYPLYSVSQHGSMDCLIEKVKPLLEKYHISAYISGHDHSLQHIVTEHPLSPSGMEKFHIHYIVSGAGSRSDYSIKNINTVPEGSLRFNYPTGFNPFSQIGLSKAGFASMDMDKEGAELKFYNRNGNELYSSIIIPRRKSIFN